MLIDRTHLAWGGASALVLAAATVGYAASVAGERVGSGGSPAGLAFGLLSLAAMSFAGLLAVRKKFPGLRLGSAQFRPRGHIWLGLLSVPFALFHANFRFGGAVEMAFMLVFFVVIASGFYGLALQQVLPRLLKVRVPLETFPQQIPYLCEQMKQEADRLLKSLETPVKKPSTATATKGAGTATAGAEGTTTAAALARAAAAKASGAAAGPASAQNESPENKETPTAAAKPTGGAMSVAEKLAAARAAAKQVSPPAATPIAPDAAPTAAKAGAAAMSVAEKLAAARAAGKTAAAAKASPAAGAGQGASEAANAPNPAASTGSQSPAAPSVAAKIAAARAATKPNAAAPRAASPNVPPVGSDVPSLVSTAPASAPAAEPNSPLAASPVAIDATAAVLARAKSSAPGAQGDSSGGRMPRLELLVRFYQEKIVPFLDSDAVEASRQDLASENYARMAFGNLAVALPGEAFDAISRLEAMVAERRQFLVQVRIQNWLRNWLMIHVPLSAALFVLAAVHVISALRVVPLF